MSVGCAPTQASGDRGTRSSAKRLATVVVAANVIWLAGVTVAQAQLNASEPECMQRWGPPVSTQDIGGVRIVSYVTEDYRIEATMIGGVAHSVKYRGPAGEAGEAKTILDSNSEGLQWAEWQPPGAATAAQGSRRWMRSDKMAMASFDGDTLVITGGAGSGAGGPPVGETAPGGTNANSNAFVSVEIRGSVSNSVTAQTIISIEPVVPKDLPPLGASREEALAILGKADGWMRVRSEEILTYAWGQVFLSTGKVVAIRP